MTISQQQQPVPCISRHTCRILHDMGIIRRKRHADTDREDLPFDNSISSSLKFYFKRQMSACPPPGAYYQHACMHAYFHQGLISDHHTGLTPQGYPAPQWSPPMGYAAAPPAGYPIYISHRGLPRSNGRGTLQPLKGTQHLFTLLLLWPWHRQVCSNHT